MATDINIRKVRGGYNYTVRSGMGVAQDDDGNTFYTPADTIVGGYGGITEEEAREKAQAALEDL